LCARERERERGREQNRKRERERERERERDKSIESRDITTESKRVRNISIIQVKESKEENR
jgi:hypothetical protein